MNFYSVRRLFLLAGISFFSGKLFAQPVITGITPASGITGSVITISGSGFSSIPTENRVYFGGAIAQVTAAGSSLLTVVVPSGARYSPVSTTVNGLTGYSPVSFLPSFNGNGASIIAASMATPFTVVTGPSNPAPSSPVGVDIDGDGKPDIVSGNSNLGIISVLRNTGSGNLSFDTSSMTTFSFWTLALAAADFDGDGKQDIASISYGDRVSVFKNTSVSGAVSFAQRMDMVTNTSPFGIAVGDLDGDGRPDIVVANNNANNISIYRNTSSAGVISFANKVDVVTGNKPYAIEIGDLNGDGKPEIVVSNSNSNTLSIYRNISTPGTISVNAKMDFATGNHPIGVAIGDIDGDGKPDLLSANYFGNGFSVLRNIGTGNSVSFASKTDITTFSDPQSMALADMNGDGKPDVVLANYNKTATINQNNSTPGAISFSFVVSYPNTNPADGIALNDLDGDGKPEMVIGTNTSGPGLNIFRNKVSEPVITGISPLAAGAGETVTISGTNFSGTSSVSIGGQNASGFTVVNATTITAVVANGAFTSKVAVTTPFGSGEANLFQYKGPNITSFSPIHGGLGTSVSIQGLNFTGATGLSFGGSAAASFAIQSNTVISAVVDTGITGMVKVTTPFGYVESGTNFTFYQKPVITHFTPASAGIGAEVIITGSRLSTASAVTFGGVPASGFTVEGDTAIKAIVSTGASGYVMVTTIGGTTLALGFIFTGPVIQSFSPQAAHAGDTVRLNGLNFSGTSNVSFGTQPASFFQVISDTLIYAIVSNGATGTVQVTTANGTAAKAGFMYTGPVITSFSPAMRGPGQNVIIKGRNFTGATIVTFGGTPSASFSIDSDTAINAIVDTGSSGDIVIISPKGMASRAGFIFVPTPQITSFSPMEAGLGNTITIYGKHFINVSLVLIGSQPASSFSVINDTLLTAVVGNTNSGSVFLQTAGGFAVKPGFVFIPAPLIQSFTPVISGTGSAVTIKGKYFSNAYQVRFGNIPAASFQVINDTIITAVVGAGATGSVSVTTIGGTGNKTGFTYVPPPVLRSFSPASTSIATTVIIKGQFFTGTTSVSFGGVAAVSFNVSNDSTITAIVGIGGSGYVKAGTPYGSDSATGFIYRERPLISSFSPASGPVGTTVTINGSNFNPVATNNFVFFGAAQATIVAASATSLIVVVPTGATSLPLSVTTHNLIGYAAMPFIVIFPGGGKPFSANSFAPRINSPTNQAPKGVAMADVDKDGKPDVVAATGSNGVYSGISVLRNLSSPNYLLASGKVDYIGISSNTIVMADFDGDGWPDLATSNEPDINAVSIYKNTGNGTFANGQTVTYNGLGFFYLAIGDIDGDGKTDLVMLSSYSQRVIVMRNTTVNGIISFQLATTGVTGAFGKGVAVADMDGDGKPDIISGMYSAGNASVFRNNSTPGNVVLDSKSDFSTGSIINNLAVADVDGDGKADIVTTSGSIANVLRNTSNPGTFSFAPKISYTYGSGGNVIIVADVDGDGKPELLAPYGSNLGLLRNTSTPGSISFAAKVDYGGFSNAYGVAAGDLDGDGKPDLAVTSNSTSVVSLLRNQVGEPMAIKLCPPSASTTITSPVSGVSYQWQVDTGIGFANLSNNANYSGVHTGTLQLINIPSVWTGYVYRCMIDGNAEGIWRTDFSNTWTGTASAAWENPANWSCGVVPDINTNVIINAGNVVINSNVVIRTLVLAPVVILTVITGNTLTLTH